MTRADVLREIAKHVLTPTELLAAWAGGPVEAVTDRPHRGVFSSPRGSYLVHDDVVDIDGYDGITEQVPLAELHALAAATGSHTAAERLRAAIADVPRAGRDADRYIRQHGGLCLTPDQQRAADWLAIRHRLIGVSTAVHLWWHGGGVAGEQLDLFG